jgi:type II secretory pathway pseudopilin PulG
MTNSRMTNDELSPNHEARIKASVRHSGFGIPSSFVPALRDHSSFRAAGAFTLIELLIVMAIIIVLAGLILGTANYVQKKGYRSRAEAEIAAISAALENYKADNGVYPLTAASNSLDPISTADYKPASRSLYTALTGDDDDDPTTAAPASAKNYFGSALKPNMLGPVPAGPNTYLRDPFGNSYGYSTAKASNPTGTTGFNPTFDLWSIADGAPGTDQSKWIKNW